MKIEQLINQKEFFIKLKVIQEYQTLVDMESEKPESNPQGALYIAFDICDNDALIGIKEYILKVTQEAIDIKKSELQDQIKDL